MKKYKFNEKIEVLKEKQVPSGFFEMLEKIEKLTDRNAHTLARIEIAKFFKQAYFVGIFEHINKLHDIIGSMPRQLILFKDDMTDQLMDSIEQEYGEEIKNQVNGCL